MNGIGIAHLVYVEWEDARGVGHEWRLREEATQDGTCIIRSVGWLVKPADRDGYIVVAPHVGDEPLQCCGEMNIPVGAVRHIIELRQPKPGAEG